jgi:hypothetical protein
MIGQQLPPHAVSSRNRQSVAPTSLSAVPTSRCQQSQQTVSSSHLTLSAVTTVSSSHLTLTVAHIHIQTVTALAHGSSGPFWHTGTRPADCLYLETRGGRNKRYGSVERYILRLRREDLCRYTYCAIYCSNRLRRLFYCLVYLTLLCYIPCILQFHADYPLQHNCVLTVIILFSVL